jgi:hypothetical protein
VCPAGGRGGSLNRQQRAAVWAVIEQYRAMSRARGTLDFPEVASVAANTWLPRTGGCSTTSSWTRGRTSRRCVPWWSLGQTNLFIAEDSHQRIYGQKVTRRTGGSRPAVVLGV